jgi:hypothetical protein
MPSRHAAAAATTTTTTTTSTTKLKDAPPAMIEQGLEALNSEMINLAKLQAVVLERYELASKAAKQFDDATKNEAY